MHFLSLEVKIDILGQFRCWPLCVDIIQQVHRDLLLDFLFQLSTGWCGWHLEGLSVGLPHLWSARVLVGRVDYWRAWRLLDLDRETDFWLSPWVFLNLTLYRRLRFCTERILMH